MRCPACGHGNRPDRRYCAECGGRLGATCPACGAPNEVREKFCGACGASLVPRQADQAEARKAADTSDRARKAVTSRIRESIERIGREHPALARHFENAIRTGTFCRYQPDRPLRWQL